eukprot:12609335-Alexandrium_andersonii.AAC.1
MEVSDDTESNAYLLEDFCRGTEMLLPASWQRRKQADMVTYRAPGVSYKPTGEPDPADFAELDM